MTDIAQLGGNGDMTGEGSGSAKGERSENQAW